jgi:hypothetical protein
LTIFFFLGDFINQEDLDSAVAGCEIIYYLACTTLPKSSNDRPLCDVETNIFGRAGLEKQVSIHIAFLMNFIPFTLLHRFFGLQMYLPGSFPLYYHCGSFEKNNDVQPHIPVSYIP